MYKDLQDWQSPTQSSAEGIFKLKLTEVLQFSPGAPKGKQPTGRLPTLLPFRPSSLGTPSSWPQPRMQDHMEVSRETLALVVPPYLFISNLKSS